MNIRDKKDCFIQIYQAITPNFSTLFSPVCRCLFLSAFIWAMLICADYNRTWSHWLWWKTNQKKPSAYLSLCFSTSCLGLCCEAVVLTSPTWICPRTPSLTGGYLKCKSLFLFRKDFFFFLSFSFYDSAKQHCRKPARGLGADHHHLFSIVD